MLTQNCCFLMSCATLFYYSSSNTFKIQPPMLEFMTRDFKEKSRKRSPSLTALQNMQVETTAHLISVHLTELLE